MLRLKTAGDVKRVALMLPGISSFTRIDSGTYAMSVENATRILSRLGREEGVRDVAV